MDTTLLFGAVSMKEFWVLQMYMRHVKNGHTWPA